MTTELTISKERMLQEATIANDMRDHVRAILARPNSIANIKGNEHVTRVALLAMAGHLNVQCEMTQPDWSTKDPVTDDPMVMVECKATRPDGIASNAFGYCSYSEMLGTRRRWPDSFAMASMAQTRAQVRALSALFQPIIQVAMGNEVHLTPAEDMPTGAHPIPNRALVTSKTDSERAIELSLPDGDTYRALMISCKHAGSTSPNEQQQLTAQLRDLGLRWNRHIHDLEVIT